MKKLFYIFLSLLTLFNVYLSSSLVRRGEVNFFNDVARDFLLLQEMDQKKIVLIGPRSSTNNLFHGPLWTYINYPAYVMGNGNPVVVAWYWIFLECIFLITGFYMTGKLFNSTFTSLAFIALASIQMVSHVNGIFHAEATFFFIPMLFFTIAMYIKNKNKLYLAFHILALAIFIQLEIGVGLQFFILSMILIIWFIIKNKLWKHFFIFLLFPVFLSNLIIFDIRNGLRMIQAIFSTGRSLNFFIPFNSWLDNRINNTVSLQLFNNEPNSIFAYIVFFIVITATVLLIKNKNKYRHIYILFLFYYFGYMVLSFFNKGLLLVHYVYLLVPFACLWLVSFLSSKYKLLFLPLICIIYYLNFNYAIVSITTQESFIGKSYNSWKSLSTVAKEIVNMQKNREFGYFVYAPDAFAYQPRYAMIYNFKAAHVKAFEYVKKSTTYIVAAPPPANNPYMSYVWWRKIPVGISVEPIETKKFPSGFTIEKFNLSPEQQFISHDKSIELGIHFR